MTDEAKAFYTPAEVGDVWGINEPAVLTLIECKRVRAVRIAHKWRIPADEVQEVLKMQKLWKGSGMGKNGSQLENRDFSKLLNNFEGYTEALSKLQQLTTARDKRQSKLEKIQNENLKRAGWFIPEDPEKRRQQQAQADQETADKILKGQSHDENKAIAEERRVVSELAVLSRAVEAQKVEVDTLRRRASHRVCQMLHDQFRDEIMVPIRSAIVALRDAKAREIRVRAALEAAGISTGDFPGFALPLGNPNDNDSLFHLKLAEIDRDYHL
jgi:hypothetical protein